jgi:hypothetical protein
MLNHLHKNVILVIRNIFLFFFFICYFSDIGRATYAEMLYRTNLIAYVPADHVTGLSSNVGTRKKNICIKIEIFFFLVNVYDDQRKIHVLELCFNTSVASIRMTRTRFERFFFIFCLKYFCLFYRLLIVLVNKILIFSFPNQCQLLHTIETRENPKGLCEISNNDGSLLAFPFNSKSKGGFIQLLVSKRKKKHLISS